MSHVVGFLMLFYNEESCFWFLCTLIDSYLPSEFYAPSLLGVRVDTEVLGRLLAEKQKKLAVHFAKYDIDIRLVALKCQLWHPHGASAAAVAAAADAV